MPYATFMLFNVAGGITWVTSMSLLGYFLGGFEIVRKHNEKVIILIVLLSILPAIVHAILERRKK
jgi:membrane-associated protein